MKLYELIDLFIEDTQEICVYDIDESEPIYEGEICDINYKLTELEVGSIDTIYEPTNIITINVYSE